MAVRSPKRVESLPDGRFAVTFHGETALYTPAELEFVARLEPNDENENAARFIHLLKARLDASMAE